MTIISAVSSISARDSLAADAPSIDAQVYPRCAAEGDEQESSEAARAKRWGAFTRILRQIGAVVLVCSAVAFLLQQWAGLDSLLRYYSFLAFTLFMSGCGVYCGVRLTEDKGARTFLGIAALFLPAHFAQLGALVRSLFIDGHETLFAGYNQYLRDLAIYKAPSVFSVAATVAIACAFLLPACYAGLASLARAEARRLTFVYVLLNALLLVPTRDPALVALLASSGLALLAFYDFRFFTAPSAMRTWEGNACRLMMIAPLVVLLARSIILYPTSNLIVASICALAAVLLFLVLPGACSEKEPKCFLQDLSLVPACLSWYFFAAEILQAFPVDPERAAVPLIFLPMAALIALLSFASAGTGRGYRRLSAWLAILSVVWQLYAVGGLVSSFLCVVVSILTICSAFLMEEKTLFNLGSLGLFIGLIYHLRYAADFFSWSPWLSLAAIGCFTVISASYLERNHYALIQRCRSFRSTLDSWS